MPRSTKNRAISPKRCKRGPRLLLLVICGGILQWTDLNQSTVSPSTTTSMYVNLTTDISPTAAMETTGQTINVTGTYVLIEIRVSFPRRV